VSHKTATVVLKMVEVSSDYVTIAEKGQTCFLKITASPRGKAFWKEFTAVVSGEATFKRLYRGSKVELIKEGLLSKDAINCPAAYAEYYGVYIKR